MAAVMYFGSLIGTETRSFSCSQGSHLPGRVIPEGRSDPPDGPRSAYQSGNATDTWFDTGARPVQRAGRAVALAERYPQYVSRIRTALNDETLC